jgi:hypothetical protein
VVVGVLPSPLEGEGGLTKSSRMRGLWCTILDLCLYLLSHTRSLLTQRPPSPINGRGKKCRRRSFSRYGRGKEGVVDPSPIYGRRWPDEIRSDEGCLSIISSKNLQCNYIPHPTFFYEKPTLSHKWERDSAPEFQNNIPNHIERNITATNYQIIMNT